jgi:electron transfer flavoprotein alpha subunit
VAVGTKQELVRYSAILASYGADLVLMADHLDLASYRPEIYSQAIAGLVAEYAPWGLLLSASERGRDWGPRLAARLGLGLTGDAIGLETAQGQRMVALKPAFGGNIVAPILSKTYPQMATVRAGVFELGAPNERRVAETRTVSATLDAPLSTLVREHSLLDPTVTQLDGAEIVVGIGTGVGGPEGVAEITKLAQILGAALCATRRVTDAGWVPRQIQVGLTGKAIDPRLYIAVGIRGAPNHTVGIKRAETIVAINNDPDAPIFEWATIGVVADWAEIVPALIKELSRRQKSSAA